ncbi:zf-C3HC4_3 domain-containing protein, partial [Cephalotus follicularis]
MASSQVEIASSSPFGCVLRDHNRRDLYRDSNNATRVAFQKNLKELVRDHLTTCVSISSVSTPSNDKSQNIIDSSLNNDNSSSGVGKDYDSFPISPRHARILDRWAAKQAREMVSSIEKQSQQAQPLSSTKSEHNSPQKSPDPTNLGASSLVQMWEARLNRSNSMNMNVNGGISGSRTSSSLSYTENASFVDEPSKGTFDNTDSADETYDTKTNNEDSLMDWESQSDRTSVSEPPPSIHGRNSDDLESENERVRVADIIRKLTSASEDNNDQEMGNGSPRERRPSSSSSDQGGDQRGLSQVVSLPRIRGRQAFAHLLLQMERDRHRELDSLVQRQAVSRFSQRGRIQSMLRLRFLHRGMAIQDHLRPLSSSEVKQKPQGSVIMHLSPRGEAVNNTGNLESSVQSDATFTRRPCGETVNNKVHLVSCSATNKLCEESRHQDASRTVQQNIPTVEQSLPQTSEEIEKEAMSLNSLDENERDDKHQMNEQQQLFLDVEEETAETTSSYADWDENEIEDEQEVDDNQFYAESSSHDWFSNIARPRSYWEDRRQAWYQEVLTTTSENEEIRRLLERSWSYRDGEVGDDSDQVASTSPRQPLQSPSYYHDSQPFSFSANRPSMEMELIYDLRGHMEQLQREMSELRKCMMSCMEMQIKLQQSIQQEAHSGRREGNCSLAKAPRQRSCCICYEMQVDSLLYRCGHMCTCLKCAQELQWGSGKCPICRAPIVDVVRAYMDS